MRVTKHGSSGKIKVKMSNKGDHFDLTNNNIHGLHGSLVIADDKDNATLTITTKTSNTADVCPGPAIVPYYGRPLEIHVHVHVHTA